ncbi:negative regulator of Ofd1/Enhancer of translation termination 1 [Dipodascopsis tothii]|uniref:negative regulator of Ofd1/Enhancer of translation termination 1 n=1 Tax=Dipodascopsis tothii TaxID=44089 RepID=UPI0034CF009A
MGAKRAPQGLSKASKRSKTEKVEPEEATIELPDGIDPEDEVGAMAALLDTYRQSDRDSPKVLHAVVHEADRILRNSTAPEALPAQFHQTYSAALLYLSAFAKKKNDKTEGPEDFIAAAIERASLGLEHHTGHVGLLLARAEANIAGVERKTRSAKAKSIEAAIPYYRAAREDYEAAASAAGDARGPLVDVLRRFSKVLETTVDAPYFLQKVPESYDWLEGAWKAEQAKDASPALARALGELYLARAQPFVAQVEAEYDEEGSDDDDDDEPESEAAQEAQRWLTLALEQLQRAEADAAGEYLAVVAEAQISLANLKDEGDEQTALYAAAVERLTRAQELGAGDYSEMISELS